MTFTVGQLLQIQGAIDIAADSYYNEGVAMISDDYYDKLLEQLHKHNPSDERLTRVGHVPTLNKVKHDFPMGSLDNIDINKPDELANYLKRNDDNLGDGVMYHVTPKIDGSSIVLTYENGELVKAATRGNGDIGQDITAKASLFKGVPQTLSDAVNIVVRGEAVMHRETFTTYVKTVELEGVRNPRNTGNGIIVRKDAQGAGLIHFYAFNTQQSFAAADPMAPERQYEFLEGLGFICPPFAIADGTELSKTIDIMMQINVPYDVDGAVVKINDPRHRDFINRGCDPLRLRSDRAIKFNSKKAETVVTGVTVTVGASGKITPTLTVEPVEIGGIINSNVLIYNYAEPVRLQIGIGDTIQVVLAGDIIPKVLKVVNKANPPTVISAPDCCPACSGPINHRKLIRGQSVDLYCQNENCPGIKLEEIKKFVGSSKRGMGILGIGENLIETLIGSGQVTHPSDLYAITEEELAVIPMGKGKVGKSRAKTIVANIQASRSASLTHVLGALPIDGLGKRRAELMVKVAGGSLDTFEQWISWIGDSNPIQTLDHPHLPQSIIAKVRKQLILMLPELINLRDLGLGSDAPVTAAQTPFDKMVEVHDKPFLGTSFCFTGTRIHQDVVERLGGEIKSGVSKALNYLVQRDVSERTTKAKKAESYGTTVIGVKELEAMILAAAPGALTVGENAHKAIFDSLED